jgi:glycosyltransferase involved in cell wall biosynthesis
MKVILIARTIAYGGGAERLVFETYNELKRRLGESSVMLIVFQHSSIFNINGLDVYEKKLANDPNFHCVEIEMNLSLIKKNKININQLQEIVETFKPTIIHSHLYLAELISRHIKYKGVKWFSHFHDNMEQFDKISIKSFFSKKKLTNLYEKKYLFNKYENNSFIAISKDTFNYAKKRIKHHKLHLLHNAINLSEFYRFKKINFDKLRIINIGSFVEKKNHKFIIQISKELKNRKVDFEITLLGDGPLIEQIKKEVDNQKLNKEIKFPGIVSNVNEYLNDANIYLHTATYEPFGLVLIESMAVGLPIVTLNGKGNSDLICQNINGFLIEEENENHFCDVLINLFKSKEKYLEISKNAVFESQKYNLKEYITKLINIYNQ